MSKSKDNNQRPLSKKVTAALTGIVGAAAFYRLGGDEVLSKGIPKIGKFVSKLSDDLGEMKLSDYNADNIGNLVKKHFTDDNSTFKTLSKLSEEPMALKVNGDNVVSSLIKLEEIKASPNNIMRTLFNSDYSEEISANLENRFKTDHDSFKEQISQLAQHVLKHDDLTVLENGSEVEKLNIELIDRYLDPEKFTSSSQRKDFYSELAGAIDNSEVQFNRYLDKHRTEEDSFDFIDNINEQFSPERLSEKYGRKKEGDSFFTELIQDSKKMTLNDYKENVDKFSDQNITLANGDTISVKDTLMNFIENNDNVGDIILDGDNFRLKDDGTILDYTDVNKYKTDGLRSVAGTLPGKIMKLTDRLAEEESGSFNILRKGNGSLNLRGLKGEGGDTLQNDYVRIMNNLYRVGEDNKLENVEEFSDFTVRSSRHGTVPRLLNKIFSSENDVAASNKYTKWLDFNTSGEDNIGDKLLKSNSKIGDISRKITGTEQYNIIDRVQDGKLLNEDPLAYRKNLRDVSNAYSHITNVPSNKTIEKMQSSVHTDLSKDILKAIQSDDHEEIINLINQNKKTIRNSELVNLTSNAARDRQGTATRLTIQNNQVTGRKNVLKFNDLIKREAFKEVLLNEALDQQTGVVNHTNILDTLKDAGLKDDEHKNAKNLAFWAVFQQESGLFKDRDISKKADDIKKYNDRIAHIMSMSKEKGSTPRNIEFVEQFQKSINSMKSNYSNLTTKNVIESVSKSTPIVESNDVVLMKKGYSGKQYALDMISSLNDSTKTKAKENTKRFAMQFVAGKNSPEYVTGYTMAPYFFTERLIDPLNSIGLGFSNENMTNVGKQWAAIMTKRVMPAAVGLSAMSYLNFEAKNITGTSLTGAFAQGIANVDLGVRKITDATGIGHIIEADRRLNPITQYWFGDKHQDYEDRKEYYENGYDEVRKGRWWAFGSASELKGGGISYFQPNFVKRANSDWRDVGLYGSADEKWKHSWMPTIRHPLSPIRRALDPYWLERKHYNDRPYLETAPLFSAGTPWGAVLNPTIGQAIKPIRKMHGQETKRGLTDPRTLIAERNERIKAKAIDKDRENIITVGQNGISNMTYVPKALADKNSALMTIRVGNGRIQSIDRNGIGYAESLTDASDVEIGSNSQISDTGDGDSANSFSSGIKTPTGGLVSSIASGLETTAVGSLVSNSFRNFGFTSSYDAIAQVNYQTKDKAATNGSMRNVTNLADMPAKYASQRIITRQDESDLLMTTSKHDFVNDVLFSGGQLSGIYNFLYSSAKGPDGRKIRPESADKLASFKTQFWDANVGGLGGGVMEITRRFFPHDDHSWTEINPIRNTMPDWIPERFRTADPYRKVAKGEMRLPGDGYESIHKLRPDEFGRYGALDRMRILGDIAPWSDEYKTWRDIAGQTVTDKRGKQEIKDIRKRVDKQSRSHEFYSYNYLGKPTEMSSHFVDKVEGTTITTTSGEQFRLGGVNMVTGSDLSEHLQSGTRINVEYLKDDAKTNRAVTAAIYVNGDNLSKKLVRAGAAEEKENGETMDIRAMNGNASDIYGATMEAIAHAPIPYIHNKLMRIDTPLESYKNERMYGTAYSTWNHPIEGLIKPALHKTWSRGPVGQGIALGGWALAEQVWKNSSTIADKVGMSETSINRAASVFMNMTNPGAFTGSMMAAVPTGLMDSGGLKGLVSASVFGAGVEPGIGRNAARFGATAMIAGYGITRSDKPLQSTAIFSLAGISLAAQLKSENFTGQQGMIAGAAVGLAISALRNPTFNKDKMFGKYTPESTKRRWDIDEYYDRLEYIKYAGLYEKSARRARIFEHTNIKKIINANEYAREHNQDKIDKLNKQIERVNKSMLDSERKSEKINELNSQIYELSTAEVSMKGGKYTKAAVAYKQAMDSTIYGLQEGATSQQVLRAIPKGDKDYFMSFMKEKDKKERKEILKYISPYQRKALQIVWGEDHIDKIKDNKSYFRNHFMPGVFWAGWKPQVDMDNVKIKTIENEGMILSDFGIYDSQAQEPDAVYAPSIGGTYDKANNGAIGLQARLNGALSGAGLIGTKVSVSPSSANGIQVVANVTNGLKITDYKIRQSINKVTGTRMFY